MVYGAPVFKLGSILHGAQHSCHDFECSKLYFTYAFPAGNYKSANFFARVHAVHISSSSTNPVVSPHWKVELQLPVKQSRQMVRDGVQCSGTTSTGSFRTHVLENTTGASHDEDTGTQEEILVTTYGD